MANYISTIKLTSEIEGLVKREQKNYCFILAENSEDEAMKIKAYGQPETIFIVVRKDKWQLRQRIKERDL